MTLSKGMICSLRATTGQEDVIVLRNVKVQEISEGFGVPAKGSPLQNMSVGLRVLKNFSHGLESSQSSGWVAGRGGYPCLEAGSPC